MSLRGTDAHPKQRRSGQWQAFHASAAPSGQDECWWCYTTGWCGQSHPPRLWQPGSGGRQGRSGAAPQPCAWEDSTCVNCWQEPILSRLLYTTTIHVSTLFDTHTKTKEFLHSLPSAHSFLPWLHASSEDDELMARDEGNVLPSCRYPHLSKEGKIIKCSQ